MWKKLSHLQQDLIIVAMVAVGALTVYGVSTYLLSFDRSESILSVILYCAAVLIFALIRGWKD